MGKRAEAAIEDPIRLQEHASSLEDAETSVSEAKLTKDAADVPVPDDMDLLDDETARKRLLDDVLA